MIACPGCGFSPKLQLAKLDGLSAVELIQPGGEVELKRFAFANPDAELSVEDELDFFQVLGCGNDCVMCPKCSEEFQAEDAARSFSFLD